MREWRGRVSEILRAGVRAVDAETLVADHLRAQPGIGDDREIVVLAIGKAAAAMARGAAATLPKPFSGVAVCPTPDAIPGFDVIVGDHPIPGSDSFEAGRRLIAAATAAGSRDLVLVLLSGGASAMAEVPAPGIERRRVIDTNAELLLSGRPIEDVNRRRAALSALKGGGLARAARPARVVTLAISDVVGGGPDVIGSGPSVGSDEFVVLADGATAADASARACRRLGLAVELLSEPITGDASGAGRRLGDAAAQLAEGTAIVGFGETTVQVDAGGGRGGRNQELALAASTRINGTPAILGSMGTDGIDGPTANAGAIVDGSTTRRGSAQGLDASAHLAAHDSASYLEAVGDVVVTGPTGTNVGDLLVALKP